MTQYRSLYLLISTVRITRALLLECVFLVVVATLLYVWQVTFPVLMLVLSLSIGLLFVLNNVHAARLAYGALHDVLYKRKQTLLVLMCAALLAIWSASLESSVFVIFFCALIFYKWDARVSAVGALLSLSSCPLLLSLDEQTLAEQMAVYAYYFLVITVVVQIIELWREPTAHV